MKKEKYTKETLKGMRIRAWTKRNRYGTLINPRCITAHLEEILLYAPNALSEEEMKEFAKRKYNHG